MKQIHSIIIMIMLSGLVQGVFAENNSQKTFEVISYSQINTKNLVEGFSIVMNFQNHSHKRVKAIFRNWEYDYVSINKTINNVSNIEKLRFSIEKPFQKFHDSFVLEKLIINNESFVMNKQFLFNELHRSNLGKDIYFSNLTYRSNTGLLILNVNYTIFEGYDIVSFYGRDLEKNGFLFEKLVPLNKGNNSIVMNITKNLSSFYIKADSLNDVPEYSELNNIAKYPFKKKEICGDGIDNNDNNIIDESCPTICPEIIPQNNKWTVMECRKSNWNVEYYNESPSIISSNESKIIIAKQFKKNHSLFINSTVPTAITTSFNTKQICSGLPITKQFTLNASNLYIYAQGIENSTISIQSSVLN